MGQGVGQTEQAAAGQPQAQAVLESPQEKGVRLSVLAAGVTGF